MRRIPLIPLLVIVLCAAVVRPSAQEVRPGGGPTTSIVPTTTFPSTVTSMSCVGDSIDEGLGLPQASYTSPSNQSFCALLADMFGVTLASNLGQPGWSIPTSIANSVYSLTPSSTLATASIWGANDITFATGNAANQQVYTNAITAMLAWLTIPAAAKVMDASITYTGTWTQLTEFGLSGHFSNTNGDFAQATNVNGTAVYICGWVNTGAYGSMTVTVDSVSQGSFNLSPTGNTLGAIWPYCARFAGLSAGNHTVRATVGSTGFVTVTWIGGNGNATKPLHMAGNTIPFQGQSAGNVTIVAGLVNTAATTLAGDGLNVVLLNSNALMSTTAVPAVLQADGIHPNAYGHVLLAKGFFELMTPAVTFPTTAGKGGDAIAQILAGALPNKISPSAEGSMWNTMANFFATRDSFNGYASHDESGYIHTAINNTAQVAISSATSIAAAQLCPVAAPAGAIVNGGCYPGRYRIDVSIELTAACTTTGTYIPWFAWTDSDGNVRAGSSTTTYMSGGGLGVTPATSTTGATLDLSALTHYFSGSLVIDVSGQATGGLGSINYGTTATACGTGGPATGTMFIDVTRLD
jgi:hypothetical protein